MESKFKEFQICSSALELFCSEEQWILGTPILVSIICVGLWLLHIIWFFFSGEVHHEFSSEVLGDFVFLLQTLACVFLASCVTTNYRDLADAFLQYNCFHRPDQTSIQGWLCSKKEAGFEVLGIVLTPGLFVEIGGIVFTLFGTVVTIVTFPRI